MGFEEGFNFASEGKVPEEYALTGVDTASILIEKTKDFDTLKFFPL